MSDNSGGLSDALRNLADGPPASPDGAAPDNAKDGTGPGGELAGEVEGEIDDEAGDVIAAAAGQVPAATGPTLTAAQRRAAIEAAKLKQQKHPAKMVLIVLLFVVGGLLLIPGFWSVGILCNLWTSDRGQSARPMAAFMLVCWPLAAALLGGAALLLKQFRGAAR
jgi:hypothetical protein